MFGLIGALSHKHRTIEHFNNGLSVLRLTPEGGFQARVPVPQQNSPTRLPVRRLTEIQNDFAGRSRLLEIVACGHVSKSSGDRGALDFAARVAHNVKPSTCRCRADLAGTLTFRRADEYLAIAVLI